MTHTRKPLTGLTCVHMMATQPLGLCGHAHAHARTCTIGKPSVYLSYRYVRTRTGTYIGPYGAYIGAHRYLYRPCKGLYRYLYGRYLDKYDSPTRMID